MCVEHDAKPFRTNKSCTLLLTNVHHIYIHGVRGGPAKRVGGHNSDVVVDPDGCIILVKEAGVLTASVVIRAFIHFIRAAREAGKQHVITYEYACTVLYCTTAFLKNSMHSSCYSS